MLRWLYSLIKLLIILVVLFFASQFEYKGRKLYTYAKELPNSIIVQRAKYYITSTITGKKDPELEKKLFSPQEKPDQIEDEDRKKLKSLIIQQ